MKKIGFVFGILYGLNAFSAQTAKVVVDTATIFEKPQAGSAVVGTVSKDTSIAVSNVPTNGFYKTRIPSGVIGWVSGSDVSTVAAAGSPASQSSSSGEKKNEKATPDAIDHSRVQLSGGVNFMDHSPLAVGMVQTNSIMGYAGTAEIQFKISPLFYWGGRAEYLMASSSITSGTITQATSFSTIPLMIGGMIVPVSKSKFRLGLGVYAGVSLLTSLKVTRTVSGASSTTSYTSSDFCGYGNVQASYKITNGMALLLEGGYRLHSATGGYPASSPYAAFKPSFGGLVTRLGLEFRL